MDNIVANTATAGAGLQRATRATERDERTGTIVWLLPQDHTSVVMNEEILKGFVKGIRVGEGGLE